MDTNSLDEGGDYNAYYNPEDWYKNYLNETDKFVRNNKISKLATAKVNVLEKDT